MGTGPQRVVEIRRQLEVNIVGMAVDRRSFDPAPAPGTIISGGLSLLAYGPTRAVQAFVRDYNLELRPEPRVFEQWLQEPTVAGVVEIVVSPRSSLVGKSIKEFSFRSTFGVSPLALHQQGKTYYHEMSDRPLQPGDAVLVHGTWEQLHSLQEHHQNFIIISRYETEFQKPERAKPALASFAVAIGLMLAARVGVDPRVAAIVVGIGVSNSFLLPTHQVNALYMGPGEYRTVEYLKIGGGLSLICIGVLVTVTYLLYV